MKNLLLISLDTLRADVAYSDTFPGLTWLRKQSVTFRDTVSSAPLTPPSHATILTGRQPYNHGIRHLFRESLSPHTPTLAEHMRAAGRRTGAFVSCPGLNRFYGLGRGFETYDDEIPLLADGRDPLLVVDVKLRGTALKRADLVMDRGIEWLKSHGDEPFFLFVHTFDAHWPYEAPEPTQLQVANAYEGEVAFVDKHLSRLFDHLRERGILDDTLVVCLSDHGEDLGGWYDNDHAGERGHAEEEGHGALLYDATQHVPLMIRHPAYAPADVKDQVRLVDVVPTILEILGLPAQTTDGVSLVPLMKQPAAAGELSVAYFETFFREELAQNNPDWAHLRALQGVRIDGRYKVLWEHGGDHIEVFDLKRDPLEAKPVVLQPQALDRRLDKGLFHQERLAQLPKSEEVPAVVWDVIAELSEAVAQAGGADLVLSGSLATGGGDRYSDIDLEVLCDSAAVRTRLKQQLRALLAARGQTLAKFPATHIPLPDLDINFLEIGNKVVKVDVHYLVKTPHMVLDGAVVLVQRDQAPATAPVRSTPASGAAFFTDLHSKFCGWLWYTHSKIQRGEYWEAEDALAVMRGKALLPALQFARKLPAEGCRRLETRLARSDQQRLMATRPRDLSAESLVLALRNTVDYFESLMPAVASELGQEFRSAQLSRMRKHAEL